MSITPSSDWTEAEGLASAKSDTVITPARRGIEKSEYAEKKKKLMAAANELKSTGAALEVDIPGIVVAGNQSSGKSSVIEAISGVTLPRAMGTCTKVPIEVRLRREASKAWQAVVKIRWEVDEQGRKPSGGTPEHLFGPTLTEPHQVEKTVRRAQLAVLNPSVPHEKFVTYDPPTEDVDFPLGSSVKQLAFSRNMIVLEISGPNVPDLTLTDLPGIIQNVGKDGDRNDIKLVEDLVREYIAKDCLILLVITMKDDVRNQKAVALAQDVDQDGLRTIGVLTKADTLHGSEVEEWMKVLRGESEKLLHGYYVTRQPNADELSEGISFEEARRREADFFAKTPAWATLSHKYKKRLGTPNLILSLSDLLSEFIDKKLPGVIKQINDLFQTISEDLRKLGDAPSENHQLEMASLIKKFTDDIGALTEGRPGHEELLQALHVEYDEFKKDIRGTVPRFSPFPRKKDNEAEDDDLPEGDDALHIKDLGEEPLEAISADKTAMNLDDVREHVKKAITRELPNNVPFPAKATLMKRHMSTWKRHARGLLGAIIPLLERLLERLVHDIFGRFNEGMLPAAVRECVASIIASTKKSLEGIIDKVISQEEKPFTKNDHYLSDVEAKVYTQLQAKRHQPTSLGPGPKTVGDEAQREQEMNTLLAGLAKFGFHGHTEETLAAKLSRAPDELDYETELRVMAQTRAYWQVAYKRIIDVIPQWIDSELIIPLSDTLHRALLMDLEVYAPDGKSRCADYLSEPPSITRQREDLELRKTRLEAAKNTIKKLGRV